MILFQNISKKFGKEKIAVQDLNLEIPDGKIVGFIGPNGAGKTTTLKMLTGILAPTTGDIMINGKSITNEPLEAKKLFGFVPDNPDMFLRFKGIEYLNFMSDIYNIDSNKRMERIAFFSKHFNMEEVLNDRISSYSHGMRQKIIIMGALIHDPELWVLDEPMTGLDPQAAHELKIMMREHADKHKIVFFSTHVLEVAEKLCDIVIVINNGKVLFNGTLEDIRKSYGEEKSLETIFLEMISYE